MDSTRQTYIPNLKSLFALCILAGTALQSAAPSQAQAILKFPDFTKPRTTPYRKLYYRFIDNQYTGDTTAELLLKNGDIPNETTEITIGFPRGLFASAPKIVACEYIQEEPGAIGKECQKKIEATTSIDDNALKLIFKTPIKSSKALGLRIKGLKPLLDGSIQLNALAKAVNGPLISSYIGSWLIPSKNDFPSYNLPKSATTQAAELSLAKTVRLIWAYLVNLTTNDIGTSPPRLDIVVSGKTRLDGCLSRLGDYTVHGSYFCGKDNLVALEVLQLEGIRRRYGDGGVAFAIAHEYAHFLQNKLKIQLMTPYHELQADCLASALLLSSDTDASRYLGINKSDISEMVRTVYSLGGGDAHGNSHQRTAAFGLGASKGLKGCLQISQ
jgi:hypothetical protein